MCPDTFVLLPRGSVLDPLRYNQILAIGVVDPLHQINLLRRILNNRYTQFIEKPQHSRLSSSLWDAFDLFDLLNLKTPLCGLCPFFQCISFDQQCYQNSPLTMSMNAAARSYIQTLPGIEACRQKVLALRVYGDMNESNSP